MHVNRRRSDFSALKLLLPLFAVTLAVLFWSHQVHKGPAHKYLVPPPAKCALTKTSITWFNTPVYKLTNQSNETLHRVNIVNWSEKNVPVLYVGAARPMHLSKRKPWSAAVVNLPPHQSIWFAGSLQNPYKVSVIWIKNGLSRYQMYSSH